MKPQWKSKFDQEFDDQFTLLHKVQYVIAADEEQLYQIRVPIFRDWFNFRAKELYLQKIGRLCNDLTRGAEGAGP